MSNKHAIDLAGKHLHTIILTAREKDGSVETREVEPYSYRVKGGNELFYCYDVTKQAIRSFAVSGILSVEETANSYTPRWPVEV